MGNAASGEIYARYTVVFDVMGEDGTPRHSEPIVTTVVLTEGYTVYEDIRIILGIKYGRTAAKGHDIRVRATALDMRETD